jgi:glycosyltransferase involved in cell wall biosynthesis
MAENQTVAYVMNGYPRLSETFITHEIHQLERMGLQLRLFSVKRENEDKVHAVVAAVRAPVTYLPAATSLSGASLPVWLARNLPRFWRANAAVAWRHPLRYGRTLASALAMCWRYRGGGLRVRKVFLKEFLQAGQIAADVLRAGDVGHLHGHFCHGVTTITWFVSRLTATTFSFTAHAKDLYQAELNPGDLLERKLGAASFVATCTCANADVLRARRPGQQHAGAGHECAVHAAVHTAVHTIYHGLDTEYFSPAQAPNRQKRPLILSVGRFVEKKGFDHLIEACALLLRDGVQFRCLIVGEHGSAYEGIRRLIQERGLGHYVQLRSAVTQDELREIYRHSHVFALPCQVMDDGDRDGFPNVLAEAMAMGVPVVSTCISGIPEMIDDGVHGLLVESRDPAALAAALRRVLADRALHARLRQAGRERIVERFDSRRTTVALCELFLAQLQTGYATRQEAAA